MRKEKDLKFKTLSEITLEEYKNIHNVLSEYNESTSVTKDLDYKPLLLSMISNKSEDYFLSLPMNMIIHYDKELKIIKNKIQPATPKNYYKIKNKLFKLHTDVGELVESEFRQLAKLLLDSDNKNIFDNLPLVLSFILVPCKNKYNLPLALSISKHIVEVQYDEIDHNNNSKFLNENISIQDAFDIQFFFMQKYPIIINELLDMSKKMMEMEKSTPEMRKILKQLKKAKKNLSMYGIGIS